jgi:hypothetical protein
VSNILSTKEHSELTNTLELLKKHVEEMLKVSSDSLLIWHKNEINDWLNFLMEHRDVEELQSLEKEVNDRFFHKYNVRIEPRNLDNERLETFEKLIRKFYVILH